MFVGHYSFSFAARRYFPQAPFWALLLGVQFVDILFMAFVLLGIEKMRIVPGFTEVNPYDLYFMPYTHGLAAHLIWSVVAYLLFRFLLRNRQELSAGAKNRISLLIGLSVFSHFVCDLLVHTPDLPLLGDHSLKVGLGLWNHWQLTLALELLLIGASMVYYFRGSKPGPGFWGKYGLPIFAGFLILLTITTPLLPPPGSVSEFAVQGLFAYFAIAGLGYAVDKKRVWAT